MGWPGGTFGPWDHDEWLDAEAAGGYLNLPTSPVYRLITDGRFTP